MAEYKKPTGFSVKCTCVHEFQDALYGPKVRIATPKLKQQGRPQVVTCTVCSKEHTVGGL